MTEPIFERLEREAEQAAGVLLQGITGRFGHHGYDDRNTLASVPEGPQMSILATFKADVETAFSDFKTEAASGYNRAEEFLQQKLPAVSDFLDKAAANPAVDAILNAVHVSPSYLQAVADMVTKADQDIAALQPAVAQPADGDAQPAGAPAAA